jgi:hypothetical protein
MIELFRIECGHCALKSSPFANLELLERALVEHFAECHPKYLARLRTTLEAGRLPVIRRQPTWTAMPKPRRRKKAAARRE